MKKLRESHYEVLSRLASHQEGRIRRLPGGFWTDDQTAFTYQQGEWSTTKQILTAMQEARLLEPTGSQFKMTSVGEEALKTGFYPC